LDVHVEERIEASTKVLATSAARGP
jgi:hypothetical protein